MRSLTPEHKDRIAHHRFWFFVGVNVDDPFLLVGEVYFGQVPGADCDVVCSDLGSLDGSFRIFVVRRVVLRVFLLRVFLLWKHRQQVAHTDVEM